MSVYELHVQLSIEAILSVCYRRRGSRCSTCWTSITRILPSIVVTWPVCKCVATWPASWTIPGSSIIIFLRSNLLLVDSLIFHQFANCCKKRKIRCFYKERTQIFIKFKNFEKEYLLFDYVIIYPITVLLLREISFPLVSCYFLSLRTFHLNIMNFK